MRRGETERRRDRGERDREIEIEKERECKKIVEGEEGMAVVGMTRKRLYNIVMKISVAIVCTKEFAMHMSIERETPKIGLWNRFLLLPRFFVVVARYV